MARNRTNHPTEIVYVDDEFFAAYAKFHASAGAIWAYFKQRDGKPFAGSDQQWFLPDGVKRISRYQAQAVWKFPKKAFDALLSYGYSKDDATRMVVTTAMFFLVQQFPAATRETQMLTALAAWVKMHPFLENATLVFPVYGTYRYTVRISDGRVLSNIQFIDMLGRELVRQPDDAFVELIDETL